MDLGLEGKVVVLTGAGREHGIGWATIQELRAAGAKVVMGDIAIDPAYRAMTEIVPSWCSRSIFRWLEIRAS